MVSDSIIVKIKHRTEVPDIESVTSAKIKANSVALEHFNG